MFLWIIFFPNLQHTNTMNNIITDIAITYKSLTDRTNVHSSSSFGIPFPCVQIPHLSVRTLFQEAPHETSLLVDWRNLSENLPHLCKHVWVYSKYFMLNSVPHVLVMIRLDHKSIYSSLTKEHHLQKITHPQLNFSAYSGTSLNGHSL